MKNVTALISNSERFRCVCLRAWMNKICICAVHFCQKFAYTCKNSPKIYCPQKTVSNQSFLFYSENLAVSVMVTSSATAAAAATAIAAFDANFKSLCYNQILKQCDRNRLLFYCMGILIERRSTQRNKRTQSVNHFGHYLNDIRFHLHIIITHTFI